MASSGLGRRLNPTREDKVITLIMVIDLMALASYKNRASSTRRCILKRNRQSVDLKTRSCFHRLNHFTLKKTEYEVNIKLIKSLLSVISFNHLSQPADAFVYSHSCYCAAGLNMPRPVSYFVQFHFLSYIRF
jgi:hypothetical protein